MRKEKKEEEGGRRRRKEKKQKRRRRREDPPEGCHFLQQSVNFIFILVQLQERNRTKLILCTTLHTCIATLSSLSSLYPLFSFSSLSSLYSLFSLSSLSSLYSLSSLSSLYPLGSLTLNCLSSSLWERGEMYRRWMISLRRLSVTTTPSPTPCV